MDHFVTLEKIPDGLVFPADLTDRIWMDSPGKKLYFRGYMSKADFDRICELTRDWSFRRRLEELFQISVEEEQPGPKGLLGLFSVFRKRAVPS